MAVVWRAEMRGAAGFARPVAVKRMKPELLRGQVYAAMFVEEARVGAELAHPNVVQVFDFCQDDDGLYCLIMEWVEGLDMRAFTSYHRQHKIPIAWPLAVAVAVGALRGLAAAHERITITGAAAPVIHRDVSPSNILVGINGLVKLADFGLSRARDRAHSLTAPGIVKGKISYLAPEIVRGDQVSIHSDIYGMGVVLWETLAGRALYMGPGDGEILRQIQLGQATPLDRVRPGLPARLTQAIHQALASNPADRFASAREMAQALAGLLALAPQPADTQSLLAHAVTQTRAHIVHNDPPDKSESEIMSLSLTDIESS
jgi:serine/threonine protein kinase